MFGEGDINIEDLKGRAGVLLVRTQYQNTYQEHVEVCFQNDSKMPDHYNSIFRADITYIRGGDKIIKSRLVDSDYVDTLDRNSGRSNSGHWIKRSQATDGELKEIFESLSEEDRKRAKGEIRNRRGLKQKEKMRLYRIANDLKKSVWSDLG